MAAAVFDLFENQVEAVIATVIWVWNVGKFVLLTVVDKARDACAGRMITSEGLDIGQVIVIHAKYKIVVV